jgi:hypothetical protein
MEATPLADDGSRPSTLSLEMALRAQVDRTNGPATLRVPKARERAVWQGGIGTPGRKSEWRSTTCVDSSNSANTRRYSRRRVRRQCRFGERTRANSRMSGLTLKLLFGRTMMLPKVPLGVRCRSFAVPLIPLSADRIFSILHRAYGRNDVLPRTSTVA